MRARARSEAVLLAVLAFATLVFVYRWAFDNNRPHDGSLGWHAFHDQDYYFREAVALAKLSPIPPGDFVYGPGYPALAAPFARIGELGWPSGDPFFFADLAVWLLTIGTTYAAARRLGSEWTGVAAALVLATATPLVGVVALPWNTTAVLAALMLTLLVALARELDWRHGAVLGFAIVLAYAARYVDAAWVAAAAVTVLLARRALSPRSSATLGLVAGAYFASLPILFLHWHAFGDAFATTYRTFEQSVGVAAFDVGDVVPHALQVFVSPFYFDESGFRTLTVEPLLSSMFFVWLAPIGFVAVVRGGTSAQRLLALGYGITAMAATIFYLAYYATGTYGLHSSGTIHYFKLWWPLMAAAAVVGVEFTVRTLRARAAQA